MCVESPTLTPPTLGGGISLAPPALPIPDVGVDVCCKHVAYSVPVLPVFPPGTLTAAIGVLNSTMTSVQTFLDGLIPKCPLE